MIPEPKRPDPDALLASLAAQDAPGRGTLKIFLGAAPGVGKTWEMLSQARRRLQAGADVLAGIIETHGRVETQAQADGVPVLPRRTMAYRGQTLEEFDLDAALARHPALLLVDELAHTNVPGSRHAKRWEDVAELVAAGIPVWATLNIQHLESLNDDIARITGVRVAETLPDRVLDMADEIELVDVPPEALRDRMREGQIYRADTARRALDGFFSLGNLTALREIALRRAAQHVHGDVRDWMRQAGIAGPWPVRESLLALVGPDDTAEAVVRHAKRLADLLKAPWAVLHVERGASADLARPALVLAEELGAKIEHQADRDLVGAALAVAHARNATQFVIGRSASFGWRRLWQRGLAQQLQRRAPEYALHVVPLPAARALPRSVPAAPLEFGSLAGAALLVVGVTLCGRALNGIVPAEAMGMVYLAAVVLSATWWTMRAVLLMTALSFLAWDFFFLPPLYRITIGSAKDVVTLLVFGITGLLSGSLANAVRMQARAAQARIEGLRRVVAFSRKLGEPAGEPELLDEIARQAASLAGRAVVLDMQEPDLRLRAGAPLVDTMDEGAWAAARWSWRHRKPSGRGSATLPATPWQFLPLQTVRVQLGVLGLRWDKPADEPARQAATALADQAAAAWERVRLAGEQARITAFEETGKLRTALLASLSHDLRTPLTGIQGAAGTLRECWAALPDDTRTDLLACIDQDVTRMARFLGNIGELTRLESGQIAPRMARVLVQDVIDAALARLASMPLVAVDLEPGLAVQADAALLEQVLVNIVENAVKYAPPESLIRIAAKIAGGQVTITVADQGSGVAAMDQPHVFDSFYRARRGDRVTPGTGLGLAIAKGLTEAIGGSIRLVSPRPDAAADGAPGTMVHITVQAA